MAMTVARFKKVMRVSWTAYMHPDPKVRRRAMRELNVLQPLPKVDVRVLGSRKKRSSKKRLSNELTDFRSVELAAVRDLLTIIEREIMKSLQSPKKRGHNYKYVYPKDVKRIRLRGWKVVA